MATLFSNWSKNPSSYLKLILYITVYVLNVIVLISTGLVTKTITDNKPINLLVGNLAVVQLFGIWTMVFEAVGILTLRHPAICALQTGSFASVIIISSWTLCLLSIDCYRYLCSKQTITSKTAMVFNVATWILGTLLITLPHSLSYKDVQSSKSQCCFLSVASFSTLIMVFIIFFISVAINLWTYVLTLIVLFKKDLNDWSEVNSGTVTNNSKKTKTQIEVTDQNYTPSNLVKEVLETAFENKVTNVADNNINNQMDSESTMSYNSENSDDSNDSEMVYSNVRIKPTGVENSSNGTETRKPQYVSSVNEISHEENMTNDLKKESTKFSNSVIKTQKENFLQAFSEEIQKDSKTEPDKTDKTDTRHRSDEETVNNNDATNVGTNESLIQLKPVILVCLLNFCFIIAWTPYLTILFIYISICGIKSKVQICYSLETNLFPIVITIGLIDWIINPVIYFYVRNRI